MVEPSPKPPGFRLITDEETPPQDNSASLKLLMVALGALAQRFVIAIADLFSLAAVASTFWLFMVTTAPTPYQLIQLGLYSVFVLTAIFFVKGRR